MSSPPILVDRGLASVSGEPLLARRPELDVREPADLAAALADAPSPKVLVTWSSNWRDGFLDGLEPGDWVTTPGSGYDGFPVEALAEREVVFTNMAGSNADQVAEHAMAMALSFTRNLHGFRAQQRAGEWAKAFGELTHLAGDTCCVVGLGHVGEAVARRASAFDVAVRGVKRRVEGYDGAADEVYPPDALDDALDGARLVVLTVPLTDATRGLLGAAELELVADDAIVVNVARGGVLDADALVAALDDGEVGAACLDVTDPEPLPPESPLWGREDVLVTPHSAGQSDKRAGQFAERFLAQYDRWRAGETLRDRIA